MWEIERIINHLLSNEEFMHKVVDNEDMEELKKVIEKKSIQKKSFYTYVCTNILFHEGWTSKYFFVTYSLIHNIQYWQIEKVDY